MMKMLCLVYTGNETIWVVLEHVWPYGLEFVIENHPDYNSEWIINGAFVLPDDYETEDLRFAHTHEYPIAGKFV